MTKPVCGREPLNCFGSWERMIIPIRRKSHHPRKLLPQLAAPFDCQSWHSVVRPCNRSYQYSISEPLQMKTSWQ